MSMSRNGRWPYSFSIVNCILLWIPWRWFRNSVNFSLPWGQMNVSSTYLNQHTGLCVACSIAFFSKSSMKKFAITGESGEPIATPSYFPPVKAALGLRTPGVYSIPCECGEVYIGQSGRSIQLRIKEHNRHIRLAQPDKSAVAMITLLNYRTQNSSRLRLVTWTVSSGKPFNLKCTQTT